MKRIISIGVLAGLLAGCVTGFDIDMRPEETKDATPTAVVWSNDNNTSLASATTDLEISAFAASAASADGLLGKLKGAYATDPYVMTQVGAVSQWVMLPGRTANRGIWVEALLRTAERAGDTYVKMTCLDQLRWCGDASSAERIRTIGGKGDRSVRDFSEMVVRELTGKSIGL